MCSMCGEDAVHSLISGKYAQNREIGSRTVELHNGVSHRISTLLRDNQHTDMVHPTP